MRLNSNRRIPNSLTFLVAMMVLLGSSGELANAGTTDKWFDARYRGGNNDNHPHYWGCCWPELDEDWGNDRFRVYDVGGIHEGGPLPEDLGGHQKRPTFNPGYPYDHHLNGGCIKGPDCVRENRKKADKIYSTKVDWPVNFVFENNATIEKVKERLRDHGLNQTGGSMFITLADSWQQTRGNWECPPDSIGPCGRPFGAQLWDRDKGLKNAKCSMGGDFWEIVGGTLDPFFQGDTIDYTFHIRLYADKYGSTDNTSDDKMYNPNKGFYILGTSHLDYHECVSEDRWFGYSEYAELHIADLATKIWPYHGVEYKETNLYNHEGQGMYGCYYGCRGSVERRDETRPKWREWIPGTPPPAPVEPRVEGDHIWANNGFATVIEVGKKRKAQASANPEDDPEPEPEPELEPAIDGDVNGDDHADVVALNTSGTAYTYNAFDASIKTTSFGGGMSSSLFDGIGHHVIDVADVDADGYADLVTLAHNNVVNVYPGQADGSFGSGILARGGMVPGTFGPSGHEPIGVADVTGDKRADLVTFYAPQGNFYVHPGLESGQFGDGKTLGGGQVNSALYDRQGVYFVDVADVSGDGKADVVGLSSSPGSSSGVALTYTGTSAGLSQTPTQVSPSLDTNLNDGTGHEPLGLGDVNGDKKADLVTLNTSGQVAVYKGTHTLDEASGTYRLLESTPVTTFSSLNSSLMDGTGDDFVGLIDRTGDGKADLMKVTSEGVVYSASGESSAHFGSFTYFRNGVPSNRGDVPSSYELVQEKPFIRRVGCTTVGCTGRPQPTEHDVNADRQSDLVTLDSTGTAHTYRSIGTLSEEPSFAGTMDPAIYDGKGHYVIDIADVTGDRKADKVTLNAGTVYVYLGEGDGSFGAAITSFAGTMSPGPLDPAGYEPIAVADISGGDGKADLITFLPGAGLKVYPANSGGNGTFGSAAVSQASLDSALFDGSGSYFLDATDVNHDRIADLITATTSGTVRVYSGATNGQFSSLESSSLDWAIGDGQGYQPVGIADVNGDWAGDLVVLSSTGSVRVFEGKTTGIFNTASPMWTSAEGMIDSNLLDRQGDEVAGLLDENGDRRADIVTVRTDGSARIYRGQEDFKFKATPVVHLLEDFDPARNNSVHGHELVGQKPFFTRPGCYAVGCRWPTGLTESDVDGDRRGDLATLHTNGTAYVYPGNGSQISSSGVGISFEKAMSSALYDGTGHYLVDTTDVTGDGRADLVTVTGAGWIRVHPGQSGKTFGAGVTSSFQLPPVMNNAGTNEPIAVADVNGDRLGDLIAYTRVSGSGQLAFYPGRMDGTFGGSAEGAKFSLTGIDDALRDASGEYFLDAIDVTGDRLADVVSMDTSGSVKVYRGKPGGAFAAAITAASINPILDNGSGQEPVGLGDVNRDGLADLVTLDPVDSSKANLKIYAAKSDGSGTFVTPAGNAYSETFNTSLLDTSGEQLIGLVDFHGDGRADMVSLTVSGGYLYSYPAQTSGTSFGTRTYSAALTTNRFSTNPGYEFVPERPLVRRIGCTASGCVWSAGSASMESDVDGDRSTDLVTVSDDGTAHVFESDGSGFQTENETTSLEGRIDPALFDGRGDYTVDVADVNGDGNSDLVNLTGGGDVYVHKGLDSGEFQGQAMAAQESLEPMMNKAGDFEPIAVADVGGDGRADLVGYRGSASSGKIVSFAGQENGTFGAQATALASIDDALTDASGQYFLDVIDVNGDGRADLVSVDANSTLRIYKGQSTHTFASATTSAIGVDPIMDNGSGHEPVGVGDVTGDDKADLVTLYSNGSLYVFAGKGDGTFEAPAGGGKSMEPSYTGLDSSLLDGSGMDFTGVLDYDGDERSDLIALAPNGDVLTYRSQASSTFSAPTTSPGSVYSGRFDVSPGHQPATELPFWRRGGCVASGCDWPLPTMTQSWALSEIDPPTIPRRHFEEVSCTSASACFAVGAKLEGGAERSQIQYWDGTEWSGQTAPDPSGATASELSGVSCVSTSFCMAAGSYVESGARKTLTLTWNGTAWSVLASPNPAEAVSSELEAVSCSSSSQCIAAGSYRDSAGVQKRLGMRWSSGSWTIGSTGLPAGASSAEFSDTTCAGTCMAVGSYVDSTTGARKTMAVKSVFGIWSGENAANPSGATSSRLLSVECPASAPCTAVGRYIDSAGNRKTLVTTRPSASSTWSVSTTPNPPSSNSELTSVWCPSAAECAAVGTYVDEDGTHPLLEAWEISSGWMLGSIPAPDSSQLASLNGVHCASSSACVAVGSARYGNRQPRNLAYDFTANAGTWSVTQSDQPAPAEGNARAVSCVPAGDCVAIVGVADGSEALEVGQSLGSGGWSEMPATAEVEAPLLSDVSCTAANACTAVGVQGEPGERTTLAERWNGTAWVAQTTPNPEGAGAIDVNGVSCVSSTYCAAVGDYTEAGTTKTLAMSWNGSEWSIVSTPNPSGATASELEEVSCYSSSFCIAVGSFYDSNGIKQQLILKWNGTAWSSSATGTGSTPTQLDGVSCVSASSCAAVGSAVDANGVKRPLLRRFVFGIWSTETTPAIGGSASELRDVSCDSSLVCTAVGSQTVDGRARPLIVVRSSSWSLQSAPSPAGAEQAQLGSVACKATGDCVAVGTHLSGSLEQPLAVIGG